MENDAEGTSSTGSWELRSRGRPHEGDARVTQDSDATYTFSFSIPRPGEYEVSLWWSNIKKAAREVDIEIESEEGTRRLTVNQNNDSRRWNRLATLLFRDSGSLTIRARSTRPTIADAIRLERLPNDRPVPTIVDISPNPALEGTSIAFLGTGSDSDGTVIGYLWSSDIDGGLSEEKQFSTSSLAVGEHEISLRVQDNDFEWSVAAHATVTINPVIANERPTATILSISPNPALDGDVITFDGKSVDSDGEIVAWRWESDIGGTVSSKEDFSTAGLGVGEHEIRFRARDDALDWSAWVETSLTILPLPNVPPTATIRSISPSPAVAGEPTSFDGRGADPDGEVSQQLWESNLDGVLSTQETFSTTDLSAGEHQITFQVQDDAGEWSSVASASLEVFAPLAASITLIGPMDGGSTSPGQVDLDFGIESDVGVPLELSVHGRRTGTDDEFTIVVLPDTQNYVDSGKYPYIFTKQTRWIKDNIEAEDIVFVSHAGDVVDHADSLEEWQLADTSMSLLDGIVPYGIAPGNHDQDLHLDLPPGATGTLYTDFFPSSRFAEEVWYGGSFPPGTNWNNYQLLSAGGVDFLMLHLEFCLEADAVSWANSILADYPERTVIVTTHGLMDEFGTRSVTHCVDTEYIWDEIVVPNDNVALVLCGHMKTEHLRIDAAGDRHVPQILANYQLEPRGGNGWLRLMRFVPGEDRVEVRTYSPQLEEFRTRASSQFNFEMPLRRFQVLSTRGDLGGSSSLSSPWDGRAPHTEYEWFVALSTTDGRRFEGPLWTFETTSGAPTSSIQSVTPNPAQAGDGIQFDGEATDPDGSIAAILWESDLDGVLSEKENFSSQTLSVGNHVITFMVQDDNGFWSESATIEITVLPSARFRRGDSNLDGVSDLSDAVFSLNTLFATDDPFPCQDAADVNDSEDIDISDAITLLAFLFTGGAALPPPVLDCGLDPSEPVEESLDCADPGPCG